MADGHLKIIMVPAGSPGIRQGVMQSATSSTLITSFHDPILRALSEQMDSDEKDQLLPFGSLVGRCLRMLGVPDLSIAGGGLVEGQLAAIAPQHATEPPFSDSVRLSGTIRMLASQLAEFRDYDLPDFRLREAAEKSNEMLKGRLEFVADLSESLDSELARQGRGFVPTLVRRCLDLRAQEGLPDKHIICIPGPGTHFLYEQFLVWLSHQGVRVDVILERSHEEARLFDDAAGVASRLVSAGAAVETSTTVHWSDALFTGGETPEGPETRIVESIDPLQEAEWAVRSAIGDRARGVMPFRIAFYCRSPEMYVPFLISAATRFGLPVSASIPMPLMTNGFAKLVAEILGALSGNDVRRLGRIAASSYLNVHHSTRERLWDGLREAHRKQSSCWEAATQFADRESSGYPWLNHMLRWRAQVIHSEHTLAQWNGALTELIGGTEIVDLASAGPDRTRDRDSRAQFVLQRSMNEKAASMGADTPLTFRQYVNLALRTWEDQEVFVSFGNDGVKIATDTLSLSEMDVVYALGMLEGTLPRRRKEGPLFSDRDLQEIESVLELPYSIPNSHDQARSERDEFVRLAASARHKLVFSYPEMTDDRENIRTFYLNEIERVMGDRVVQEVQSRSDIVPKLEECLTPADSALRSALDGPRTAIVTPSLSTPIARDRIKVRLSEGVTVDDVAMAVTCPFRGVFSNRLKVTTPQRFLGLRSLFVLPVRAGLSTSRTEEFARESMARELEARIDELYPQIEPWEVGLLASAGRRLIDEWVTREFEAREAWQLKPEHTRVSVPFDATGVNGELPIRKTTVKLKGRVPTLSQNEMVSIATTYETSDPLLFEESLVRQDSLARFGLMLLATFDKTKINAIAVDISTANETGSKRQLYVLEDGTDINMPRVKGVISVHYRRMKEFLEPAKDVIKLGLDSLSIGDIRAKPSDACRHCGYGELCRVSKSFGEMSKDGGEDEE